MGTRLLLTLVALLLCPVASHGDSLTPFQKGTQAFRSMLHRLGFQPLGGVDEALGRPAESMIILIGDCNVEINKSLSYGAMRQFIAQGGTILIASDTHSTPLLFEELEIMITGDHVTAPDQVPRGQLYRGSLAECPLAQRSIRPEVVGPINLLGDLKKVATNRPSYLRYRATFDGPGFFSVNRAFAELPRGCLSQERAYRAELEQKRLILGIAGGYGSGRYIVLANHSIFINSMMLQPDNDNIAFAAKVTNWLSRNQSRKVLFIENAVIRNDFDINLDHLDPPLPHPDVLGPAVDRLIQQLEDDDFINSMIRRMIPSYRLLRYVLLAVTVYVAAWVMYRITAGRHRAEPGVKRLPDDYRELPELEKSPASIPEVARALVRSGLDRLVGQLVDREPAVVAVASATQGTWDARIRSLWEVASGRHQIADATALRRLTSDLTELENAVRLGTIRLTSGGQA